MVIEPLTRYRRIGSGAAKLMQSLHPSRTTEDSGGVDVPRDQMPTKTITQLKGPLQMEWVSDSTH